MRAAFCMIKSALIFARSVCHAPRKSEGLRVNSIAMKRSFGSAVGIILALAGPPAQAQEAWPARPVKFIVPSSPGGGTDLYARQLAQALSESLKQQFIVDNRPGASGNIRAEAGAKFLHVPFKGIGNMMPSLLGGQLSFAFPDAAVALAHIRAGKLIPLAIIEHAPQLPKVPTFAEAGFPGLEIYSSFSVVAPSGTPPAIVKRISAEIARAMKSPGLAEKLEHETLIPVFDTPELFAAHLKKERAAWEAVIRRNAIVPD